MPYYRAALCSCIATAIAATALNVLAAAPGAVISQCDTLLAKDVICETANEYALGFMRSKGLTGVTVLQNVHSGGLVAFAASDPAKVDVSTGLLPLSTVKLLVAASCWDHEESVRRKLSSMEQLLSDSLIRGNDDAGRRLASALRDAIGTEQALKDIENYGFLSSQASPTIVDVPFWSKLPPPWKERLVPAACYHSLTKDTSTKDWEDTLSIGEERFVVTALHVSRFLQAVGNRGLVLQPFAQTEDSQGDSKTDSARTSIRLLQESSALKLQSAMRATVERGTAKSIASILADTGWTIGGKTGTGPGPEGPGPQSDGWFAGLIFDSKGNPRFTVVTFVKHGGYGGGNAARISAEVARFIIAGPNANHLTNR